MPEPGRSLHLFRWLVRFYPAGFRDAYASEMEADFRRELGQARGALPLAALWLQVMWDLLRTVPSQVAREMMQDSRHSVRLWWLHPWQTVFAISALAIGIGGATGGFTVVNALFLHSLPFGDPAGLVAMHPNEFIPPHESAAQFHGWREQSRYLADATLVEEKDVNLGSAREAIRAHAAAVSWNFFRTLGVVPHAGRAFESGEDGPGRNGIAVISYGLWQQLFGGGAHGMGSTVRVDGNPLTVVGVAPPGFGYPGNTAIWQPAQLSPGNNGWATVARVKTGLTWAQARAAFEADVQSLAPPTGIRAQMRPLRRTILGRAGEASLLVLAGAMLVLVLACCNAGHMLLARVTGRALEFSIRSALGASRRRIIQQLTTECLVLSVVGWLAGWLVAYAIASIAERVQPPPLATLSYAIWDGRVVLFSMVVSLLTALLSGAVPGLALSRSHEFGARGSTHLRVSGVAGRWLIGAQVAFTLVLLSASVTAGRGFMALMAADRGYRPAGIVTVNVSLDGTRYETDKQKLAYFQQVLERLRGLPLVRSASATEFLPLYATGFVGGPFGVDGRPAKRNSTMIPVLAQFVESMGGHLVEGRGFTDAEVYGGARVAVVNERFAEVFGGPRQVVGRQLTAGRMAGWKIVGVAKGIEFETDPSLTNSNQVFLPANAPGGFFSTIVARVDGAAEDSVSMLRDAVRAVDPQVPVFGAMTMDRRLADFYRGPKAYGWAVSTFAGFALILSLLGVFGVVSHWVRQRFRELGLRLVLGASPNRVRGMILLDNLRIIGCGAGAGLAIVALTSRFVVSVVPGARPMDLPTAASLALALAAAASLTICAATRRIAQADIVEVIRAE